jgi:hypothetical protein
MSSTLGPRIKLVCCDRDRVKHTGHWLEFRMFLRRYSFAALATEAGRIVAVLDRMQRNFEPMRKQVETWRQSELTDVTAKVVIYEAFVEGKLEVPKHLARTVQVRGVPVADDLESFECVHLRIQRTGSHSSVQSHCETGRIPRRTAFPVFLTWAGYGRAPPNSAIATKGPRLHTQTLSCFDTDKAGTLRPLLRCTLV